MTVRTSLKTTSSMRPLVCAGLNALLAADRELIAASERMKIADSLDIDGATAHEYPNDHRWDYLLSVNPNGRLIAIEPHSAADSEVKVVIRKKENALRVLRDHLRPGHSVSEWHWITRGRVGFSRMDKAVRALDQNGILFGGRLLRRIE